MIVLIMRLLRLYTLSVLAYWATPTYNLGIEFVTGSFTDVTTKVLRANWGLSLVDLFNAPNPQQALFEISNQDGLFTPRNNTNLVPGRAIRLTSSYAPIAASVTGVAGSYVSSPHSAAISITGDLDLVAKVSLNDWTPAALGNVIAKWASVVSNNSYRLLVLPAGTLELRWTTNGVTVISAISSDATGFADGSVHWIRATFDADNGAGGTDVIFYTSEDGTNWTKLGATQTSAGPTVIFSGISILEFGSVAAGTAGLLIGKVYYAEVRSGINGTVVARFDPDKDAKLGITSFASRTTNEIYTVNGTAALVDGTSTTYPLFYGRLTEIQMSPIHGQRTTVLTAMDDWDRVSLLTYTTSLFQNWNVGSLFTSLMSLSAVNSFSVDSAITDLVDFAWWRDEQATIALDQIVKNTAHQLFIDGAGTYFLKSRYWTIFATAVNTYTAADDLQFVLSKDSIVNRAKINALPRQLLTIVQTLGNIGQPLAIPASGSVGFWMTFQDPRDPSNDAPTSSMVTPVSSTDFQAFVNSDGSGTDLTSVLSLNITGYAASAVVSLFNGSGQTAWLTRFQIRGYPYVRLAQLGSQFDITSSQTQFGVKAYTLENAIVTQQAYLDSFARFITGDRKNGRDVSRHTLSNEFPEILSTNPSTVFSLIEPFTGYTTQWRVRETSHSLDLTMGLRHSVTLQTETYDQAPWLVLDHPTFGQLDNGRMLAI